MTDRNRALAVDDGFLIADLFSMRLESMGDEVRGTGASAAETRQRQLRLVLTDVHPK
jgi:CheY-like chemotaxis protein